MRNRENFASGDLDVVLSCQYEAEVVFYVTLAHDECLRKHSHHTVQPARIHGEP